MNSLTRASLLIEQHRWELAERELRQAFTDESDNVEAHYLLAHCLLAREKFDDAENEARVAVHLAPDNYRAHLALAWVLYGRRRYADAKVAVEEAIRIDPYHPSGFELLSQLCQRNKDWQGMLNAANQALAIDPEDVDCNNLRAIALNNMGRREEAGQTIAAAMTRNPDNSDTHANLGWKLLEDGQREQAMSHFREALRLNPTNDWARAGIVEGLKSKNFIYRWLLAYFLYMGKLGNRTQWALVVGLYVLQNIGQNVARNNPAVAPYIQPLLYLYVIFALLTWLGDPLFNLLLFSDKSGRLALSTRQKQSAISVGGVLLTAGLMLALFLAFDNELFLLTGVGLALLTLPVSAILKCPQGWPRWTMIGAVAVLGGMILVLWLLSGLALAGITDQKTFVIIGSALVTPFVYGVIGSQFLAMGLSNVVVQR